MRVLPKLAIILTLLALPGVVLAQGLPFPDVSACDAKIDNNGDCIADGVGPPPDSVCVTGIVVTWEELGSSGPAKIYDPASGCCISIFNSAVGANPIPRGTLVRVCGVVGNFAGLAEILGAPDISVEVLDQGPLPYPCTPITASDINGVSPPRGEELESCCVSVCGEFLATGNFETFSSNYEFVDANGDTCEVRIDSSTGLGGSPIPVGSVRVTGVLGQFDGFESNLCGGYQILPRDAADFRQDDCTVAVEDKSWGDVKRTYREED